MLHTRRSLYAFALSWLALAGCESSMPSSPGDSPGTASQLAISTSALSFAAGEGEHALTLTNSGPSAIEWRAEVSAPWLVVTPGSGTLPSGSATVAVRISRQGLATGSHAGQVRIVAGSTSLVVGVTAVVEARPVLSLDATTIDLGPEAASASTRITNLGNAPLAWSLAGPPWVAILPASGTVGPGGSQTITFTPDRSTLDPGTHPAGLTLTSDGGTASIVLRVQVAGLPALRVQPAVLDFGTTTQALNVVFSNDGGRPLAWSASASSGIVGLSPSSGSVVPGAGQIVTVTANRQGLPQGTHRATIRVTSNGGDVAIPVELRVPSPAATFALAGQVVDQFTGQGVPGLRVQFDGSVTTTDAAGRFAVPGTPSTSLKALTITGDDIHSRSTFARGTDSRWRVIPRSFDMAPFNDVAREYEPRTIRWLSDPTVYIDVRPEGFAAGPELDLWISEVRSAVAGFLTAWTHQTIEASAVIVTSTPPSELAPGTIVIRFSEDPDRYSSARTVGLARTSWNFRREITAAHIWLRYSLVAGNGNTAARAAVLGHELGHALGMGHMEGLTTSIMTPRISITSLSSFDSRAGSIVYTRSPGNGDPDADSQQWFTGALSPAAAGSYDWVCGAPDRSP